MPHCSAYQMDIRTESADKNAVILLYDGALVAVLVQLSGTVHPREQDRWTIEATFGVSDARVSETFFSAADAARKVGETIGKSGIELPGDVLRIN